LTFEPKEGKFCSSTYLGLASSRLEALIFIFDMKSIFKNQFSKQPQRMISALILTSILSLGSGLLLHSATAAPSNLPQEAVAEMVKGKDYANRQ